MEEEKIEQTPKNQTATIGKLAEALSKAQSCIEGSTMDATNPFFHSRYSTLASVWDACRKPLSDNGLAIIQTTDNEDGKVIIITTLVHSSGEWIRGKLAIKPIKDDPQAVGSVITYGRRYSLAAIAGISPEDDDAEGAMERTKTVNKLPPAPPPVAPEPPQVLLPNSPLHKKIEAKIEEAGLNRDMFKNWLMKLGKISLSLLDEKPTFKTMTLRNAQNMVDKWETVVKAYEKWQLKNAKKLETENFPQVDALTGSVMAPGICPERKSIAAMTKEYCDENCAKRKGCPVWPE